MPSYRFCRPDDIPLLIEATNRCYDVHFPDAEPATIDRFRAAMKEIQVWPSSCMVALAEDGPVAVLIGTRREHEVLVSKVGVRPDHLRQGHASHLLTSLSQKLAVLGPPRLVAEVPDDLPGVSDFFAAQGYRREASYVDWVRLPGGISDPVPDELVIPITLEELGDLATPSVPDGVAWERAREALMGAREQLAGSAIATPERIEAWLLHRARERHLDVLAASCLDAERRDLLLGLLLRSLIGRSTLPVRLPKLAEHELSPALLEELGFSAGRLWGRWAAAARPV